eukprot:gnl/TRDRNA2_/TRDRNA2_167055_c0_seq2.p1 gnl/TRDRNA2_/TRDRNA2_167055_c0~~gnl/TRDRNA2_/TRDRNA2_167055_c0_seq2.p1  ORF type:complete len:117 (+),score=21.03 gnl/TRDRNA2_/TRDRNA2_167055_c0_seq2:42-392(+)
MSPLVAKVLVVSALVMGAVGTAEEHFDHGDYTTATVTTTKTWKTTTEKCLDHGDCTTATMTSTKTWSTTLKTTTQKEAAFDEWLVPSAAWRHCKLGLRAIIVTILACIVHSCAACP